MKIAFLIKIGGGSRHRPPDYPHVHATIRLRVAAQEEHPVRMANIPHAYCGAQRTFRARCQQSSRVLRRVDNIPRAQPTTGTRIAARGQHSARAANDLHAYWSAGRTFRARGQQPARVLQRGGTFSTCRQQTARVSRREENIPSAEPRTSRKPKNLCIP